MNRKLIISTVVIAAVVAAVLLLPDGPEPLLAVARWAESAPHYAWPLFLVSFVVAIVLMFPGWLFMVIGGYLFGMPIGTLLSFIANLAGSVLAFFLAKTYARQWVEGRLAESSRFKGFDAAVERNGFTTIMFARLALLPNNFLNYACGLTGMTLRDFVFGTALGSLPILLVNVLLGASTSNLFSAMSDDSLEAQRPPLALMAAIIVGVALVLIVSRLLRRKLMNRRSDVIVSVDDVRREE